MRSRRRLFIISGVLAILVILVAGVASSRNNGETITDILTDPLGFGRQSAEQAVLTSDTLTTRTTDIERLRTLTQNTPLETDRFTLRYNTAQDVFLADLYSGDRVQEIAHLQETLRAEGIQHPENVTIIYNGPHGYDDFIQVPDEFIEAVEEKYE